MIDEDLFKFSAVDVVTMLTAMETSVVVTEDAIATGKFSGEELSRFYDMLDRRRAVLAKIKKYMRQMNVQVPNVM